MPPCKDCDTMRSELVRVLEEAASLRQEAADLHSALAEWNQAAADALRLGDARQAKPGRPTATRGVAGQHKHRLRRPLAAAAGRPKT